VDLVKSQTHRIKLRGAFTGCLMILSSTSPARAGILEALDKAMRDYVGMDQSGQLVAGKGIVGQGEAAWATMSSIALLVKKAPEGSTRWKQFSAEFDRAFRSYADTYHADGTLGGDMLVDMKALVKEMLTVSNYIPGPLKKAWEGFTQGIAELGVKFKQAMDDPWDTGGGGASAPQSRRERRVPAPAPATKPAEEPAEEPAAKREEPAEESSPIATSGGPPSPDGLLSVIRASGIQVPGDGPAAAGSTDSKVRTLFKSYVNYLYQAGGAKHLVDNDITDVETRKKVYPAIEHVFGEASRMEDEVVESVVHAAGSGADSLQDLESIVKSMKPATSKFYLSGVVTKIARKIQQARGANAEEQAKKLQSIKNYMQ